MKFSGKAATVAAPLAIVLCLAGCSSGSSDNGIASQSNKDIATTVARALTQAPGVDAKGSVTTQATSVNGELQVDANHNFNFQLSGSVGPLSLASASIAVRYVDGAGYIQGSRQLWTVILSSLGVPTTASLLLSTTFSSHWIKFGSSAASIVKTFGRSKVPAGFNINQALSKLTDLATRATKGSVTTVNGQSVLPLHYGQGTLYIATTGPALPVALTASSNGSNASVNFTYPENLSIAVPTDVVDGTVLLKYLNNIAAIIPGLNQIPGLSGVTKAAKTLAR